MPNLQLNLEQFNYRSNLETLPKGWYPAVIVESEVVPTVKKDGFRLVLKFEIIDGPFKGRKIEKGYNIDNPSAQAVEISMSEIKTVCACVGVFARLDASEQLHGKPLQIHLIQKTDSDYNDIKGYKTINGEEPGKATGQAAAPAQAYVQPPTQGFGQPAPQAPQQPAWAQPQQPAPSYPPQPAAPQYAPAPAAAPQYPAPQGPPAWAPQAQQQPAAAPSYPAPAAAAPAWSPQAPPPQAPAWAQQK